MNNFEKLEQFFTQYLIYFKNKIDRLMAIRNLIFFFIAYAQL